MPTDHQGVPLAHLHAQQSEHDEAYIIANTAGIARLITALAQVLTSPTGTATAELMAADGEGFELFVIRDDSEFGGSAWSRAALPYTKFFGRETQRGWIWPWERPVQ
jgi:hypothetical protein